MIDVPEINIRALEMAEKLALDVLNLKIGQEKTFKFKDEPMTIKRIR